MSIFLPGVKNPLKIFVNYNGVATEAKSAWINYNGTPTKVYEKGAPIVPSWSTGTDQEIVDALIAHYNGEINLREWWNVGEERVVSLSAITTKAVDYAQPAHDAIMVIMHMGGKQLVTPINGHTECAFVIGMKNTLMNNDKMNSTATANGWSACPVRTWFNDSFYNAIPSSIRPIFKQYVNIQGGSSSKELTSDYFALPAEKEVFGSNTYASSVFEEDLVQFSYYNTADNRKKSITGSTSSSVRWWLRSRRSGTAGKQYCSVTISGTTYSYDANTYGFLSPFGVI